ncbi:MAG TPA: L,D-transpeptidase [Ktedonobacterales bacterium]|jgi:lipoprotein-anchoring transpeptidase ErfK/SrfK
MKPPVFSLKNAPLSAAWRTSQRRLGVLGASLLLLLSACVSSQPTAPTVISPKTVQAKATSQALLNQYEVSIFQAQGYGLDLTPYQQQLKKDRKNFQRAQTEKAYKNLAATLQAQVSTLQHIAIVTKTRYHLQQLQLLINQTDSNNDYEYINADDAYLQEQARFEKAVTIDDYQKIDTQAQVLVTNLTALLANLNDQTPHDQPHAADLQLIQTYRLTGKVIIVSLTEQTLRMYENGLLAGWMYVVTGQRAAQTPPGLWHVMSRQTHIVFKSSEPPGSPLWYPPTPINYAMAYHTGGYYLHDATWRSYFGPGANLPHHDYTSGKYSLNGTHGCINMTLRNTITLYDWARVGIPVIVY